MRVRGERVRCERVSAERSAPRLVGPVAEYLFAADFNVGIGGMTLYQGDGVGTVAITGGELGLTINAGGTDDSFWYNDNEGVLEYVEISGDFDARAIVRVRNSADSGLPTVGDGHFRIAGLAAHDPDRSSQLNYVHVGLGCAATAGIQVEIKNTESSVSDYTASAPTGASTGVGQVRIRRVGQVFTLYYRAGGASGWTQVGEYDRGATVPMPETLQIGLMCYSDQAVHDIRLFCDSLVITRPG